jgi:hypothetical protein
MSTSREHKIVGLIDTVDQAISRFENNGKPRHAEKKAKPRRKSGMPGLEIQGANRPDVDVPLANVVDVPEVLLRTIAKQVDDNTASFSDMLLKRMIPLLLCYDTGVSYSTAAMRDGIGIELEFEEGVRDAVKSVGQLMVMYHFIRKAKLPRDIKKRFMEQLTDKFATDAIESMKKANNIQKIHDDLNNLAAVVSTSKGVQVATREEYDKRKAKEQGPKAGRVRSRK